MQNHDHSQQKFHSILIRVQGFKGLIILTTTPLCHGAEASNRWQIKERFSTLPDRFKFIKIIQFYIFPSDHQFLKFSIVGSLSGKNVRLGMKLAIRTRLRMWSWRADTSQELPALSGLEEPWLSLEPALNFAQEEAATWELIAADVTSMTSLPTVQ